MKILQTSILVFTLNCTLLTYSNAQIIYTNINPDVTDTCNSTCANDYYLDLNNDGINDFRVGVWEGLATIPCARYVVSAHIYQLNSNKINCSSGNNTFVLKLPDNGLINVGSFWDTGHTLLTVTWVNGPPLGCIPMQHANWTISSDGYIGLQLALNGQIYYGWVRLSVYHLYSSGLNYDHTIAFTVKDYAYNSIPNQQILAGETGSVLPLNFLSFNGSLINKKAMLSWSTANEINNKGFDIERSTDGSHFSKIGFVNAKGNTTSMSNYNFTDSHITGPVIYYRLKQVDNDNRFSYSSVIQIKNENIDESRVTVVPNPISGSATIFFSLDRPQNVSLKIFDANGRLIQTLTDKIFEKGEQQLALDAGKMNTGIYFLRIQAKEFSRSEKLIITK